MGTSTAWGRIADDGTVYVRTPDEGERVVGSWQAGTPEEGLAHFVRRYDDLATEVGLLETRLGSGAASASSTVVAVAKLRTSLPTANAVGDLSALDERLCTLLTAAEAKRGDERAAKAEAATKAVDAKKALDPGAPVIRDDLAGRRDNHIFDWAAGDKAGRALVGDACGDRNHRPGFGSSKPVSQLVCWI